jgi:hypothetical protein
MTVKVKANTAFIHGSYNVERGEEIEVSELLAAELEGAGLVGEKMAAPARNKMAPDADNKTAEAKAPKAKKG